MPVRSLWLDYLRVLASFAVVLLHTAAIYVTLNPDLSRPDWWLANILNAFSRWCVPIFIMISGSLLLTRAPDDTPMTFYKRRLGRLFIPLAAWTIFYTIFTAVSEGNRAVFDTLRQLAIGEPFYHLWYIYMLVGFYLAAPFMQHFLSKAPRHYVKWAMIVSLLIGTLDQILSILYDLGTRSFFTAFLQYMGYFLAGYYLTTGDRIRIKLSNLLIGFIVSGALIALLAGLMQPLLRYKAWEVMYTYLNPLVIVMSLCVFLFFQITNADAESPGGWMQPILNRLVPLTLGIYLIHPFWLALLRRFGADTLVFRLPGIGILLLAGAIFLLSLFSAMLINLLPGIRRVIL